MTNSKLKQQIDNAFSYIFKNYGKHGENYQHYYTINKDFAEMLVKNKLMHYKKHGIVYNNHHINIDETVCDVVMYGYLHFSRVISNKLEYKKEEYNIQILTDDELLIKNIIE